MSTKQTTQGPALADVMAGDRSELTAVERGQQILRRLVDDCAEHPDDVLRVLSIWNPLVGDDSTERVEHVLGWLSEQVLQAEPDNDQLTECIEHHTAGLGAILQLCTTSLELLRRVGELQADQRRR